MEPEITDSSDTFYRWLAWLHANRTKVIAGVVVLAVIGIATAVFAWKKEEDQSSASAQLYAVPLTVVNGNQVLPASPTGLLQVAQQYPDTSAGEYAQLLGAEGLFTDNKFPEAEREFSKFVTDHPESALVPQAKMGVAACLESENKIQEAAQKYQEIISTSVNDANIVAPAKLTLARLEEQLNKPEQALSYYDDLTRVVNPYDPWANEARERKDLLLAKHPELKKTVAPTPAGMSQTGGFNLSAPVPSASTPKSAPSQNNNLLSIPPK